uniref:PRANC domain-containing protein n=1 Tax=Trichogramma kaykai TaxID=54128 RepID=A0ABD2X9D6_9HYME
MSFKCADNYDSIRNKLKALSSLKEQVDWSNEDERSRLLYNLYPVISDWSDDQLPELRDIFRPREIEHLLADSVDFISGFQHHHRGQRFLKFALATGYKDTPEMDAENGNEPLARRTTAIHRAARYHSPMNHTAIGELFKAYDRYDVNYVDEWGYTHFHAACEYGFADVVEKFLDAGQDPDCRLATATPKSIVDPPLHLALTWGYKDVMALLLGRGADANSLNRDGLTALQMICQGYRHLHLLKIFRVDPNKYQPLPVGPLDRIGRAPYHVALSYHKTESMMQLLLKHGADVDRADADGLTSLHMICKRGQDVARDLMNMVIQSIDDLGLSVRLDVRDKSGNTPLHLALEHTNNEAAELLLRRGADPNVANAEGSTCLHVVCKNLRSDYNAAEMLREARRDNEDRPLRIDARDNLGRTPLQWAVANLKLGVVKSLLHFGADAAKDFVFPDASYFGEQFDPKDDEDRGDIVLGLAARALAVVECLEKSGSYELNRSGVLAIATFFVKHRLFEKTAEVKRRCYDDDQKFAEKAKKKMVNPSLTLYDLIQLRAENAAKLLTYEDYLKFGRSNKFWKLPEGPRETCARHLCEKLARGFFRSWVLKPLMELTRNELPILCCEIIVDRLGNEDLCNVLLATSNVDGELIR